MKNHKAQRIPYEEMQAQQQTEIPPPLFRGEKLCFVNSFHPNVFLKSPMLYNFVITHL